MSFFKGIWLLTAVWADRWPVVCRRCVPDRWARPVRCPSRCCRVDPKDLPADRDDCSTAMAMRLPASRTTMMTMRLRHRWLHCQRPIVDCCVAAPPAVPAVVHLLLLSVAAAVGRRPRPIHLIVLLTHPNDPTGICFFFRIFFSYFTKDFFGSSFSNSHGGFLCVVLCSVCVVCSVVCVCVCLHVVPTVIVVVVVVVCCNGKQMHLYFFLGGVE